MRMVLHHVQLHSNKNKVKCPLCDRTFVDSRNMKDHMRTHSGVDKLKCKYCNFENNQLREYNKHMKDVHPTELEVELREEEMKRRAEKELGLQWVESNMKSELHP